jgi:twitching motility protein PilT
MEEKTVQLLMKRFQDIIKEAIKESLSDLYITGGHPMVSRKNGVIQFHNTVKWTHQEVDDFLSQLLSPRQLELLRERKSLDLALSVSNVRLRMNAFATNRGMSMAIRVLSGYIPTIDELNLHPSLAEISKIKSGLVLTCGGTGVGKTTTIAAIINAINTSRPAHIITLENPIEYRFQSKKAFIQQRELGTHMPSFAQGLLDALRENPDVIVIGELRETDTMQIALTAAESGHLVIATLHASTPEEAIYRLCNTVPADSQNEVRYQLASTLQWLIVQQLVYLKKFKIRVPVLTIVRGTQAIKNTIRENKLNQLESAIQIGKNEGMFTAGSYFTDYLENREDFISPAQIFRPSLETANEVVYESPLTKDIPALKSFKQTSARTSNESIIIRSEYDRDEIETMLTINEDASLQELIRKLES